MKTALSSKVGCTVSFAQICTATAFCTGIIEAIQPEIGLVKSLSLQRAVQFILKPLMDSMHTRQAEHVGQSVVHPTPDFAETWQEDRSVSFSASYAAGHDCQVS